MIVPVPPPPPAPPPEPRLVSAAELADHYGISRATVYNLMSRGMPSVQIGRCRRFRLGETDAWVNEADTRKAAA